MKILTVEDEPVSRAVLRHALARLGHETVEAADGKEAWSLLQGEHLRLIISDWMMPRVDGLELCRRIRGASAPEYTYFILLSARDNSEENQFTAMEAGVDDFLTKPLSAHDLWTRLRVAERILRSTTHLHQLEGMLPICSYCKKIRDDQNYWQQIERYLSEHSRAEFSHSICPDCYRQNALPQIEQLKRTPLTSRNQPAPPYRGETK
ncbi:MAG: response regulator [Verrucomicrobia bacterium]|nr:response regulator [Verrucomicrobiota bacterium]